MAAPKPRNGRKWFEWNQLVVVPCRLPGAPDGLALAEVREVRAGRDEAIYFVRLVGLSEGYPVCEKDIRPANDAAERGRLLEWAKQAKVQSA